MHIVSYWVKTIQPLFNPSPPTICNVETLFCVCTPPKLMENALRISKPLCYGLLSLPYMVCHFTSLRLLPPTTQVLMRVCPALVLPIPLFFPPTTHTHTRIKAQGHHRRITLSWAEQVRLDSDSYQTH